MSNNESAAVRDGLEIFNRAVQERDALRLERVALTAELEVARDKIAERDRIIGELRAEGTELKTERDYWMRFAMRLQTTLTGAVETLSAMRQEINDDMERPVVREVEPEPAAKVEVKPSAKVHDDNAR